MGANRKDKVVSEKLVEGVGRKGVKGHDRECLDGVKTKSVR